MIEGISAVTLGTHEMPRAVRFYRALGFEVLHGGEDSSFTSFRAGTSCLNQLGRRASDGVSAIPRAKGYSLIHPTTSTRTWPLSTIPDSSMARQLYRFRESPLTPGFDLFPGTARRIAGNVRFRWQLTSSANSGSKVMKFPRSSALRFG